MEDGKVEQPEEQEPTSVFLVFITILPIFFTTFSTILFFKATKLRNENLRLYMEFVTIVSTIILSVTVLNREIEVLSLFWFMVTVLLIIFTLKDKDEDVTRIQVPHNNFGYVTLVRSSTYLITSVCILAVDFNHFPIVLAKTHTYGSSLMDTGIGLFIFASGIVCKEKPTNNWQSFRKLIVTTIPLLVIGIARTVILGLLHYGQDVREYGVHWNAFIALATTRVLGSLVAGLVRNERFLGYTAIAIILFHEICLQLGIAQFVMDPHIERIGFFEANREGICSIPGYVALYLASIYIGILLNSNRKPNNCQALLKNVFMFGLASALLWGTTFLADFLFEVSRRLVNAGYVFWVLALGASMMMLFMFMEYILAVTNDEQEYEFLYQYVPVIMDAINYNGLAFFLLSNFFTGFVNMTLSPHSRSLPECLLILFLYMLGLCQIAFILYKKKIKIKL